MRAARSQAEGAELALAELCQIYWYPLYIFARRRGYSPSDAEDLTQGFFLHLLAEHGLSGVNPLKGKFRSFLLACFQNHISDVVDWSRRVKRGGGKELVQLDAEDAEERYRREPIEFLTAEKIFDARWAMTVLGEAMKRLRREYSAARKRSTFEVLEPFLDPNNAPTLPSYEDFANRLGLSASGVKTLVHRMRKRYRALVRQEVGRTVSDPATIDEEIRALYEALLASGGWLGP
jgi:RNA polymerase sigma-70 factor (ECF subfamily)